MNQTKKFNKMYIIPIVISIFAFLGVLLGTHSKGSNDKYKPVDLTGYNLVKEELVDSCSLKSIEGFYVGKGIMKGNEIYIFQAEKNGESSQNIETTKGQVDIIYLSSEKDGKKPGTIEAFSRQYEKKSSDNKILKKHIYFYKIYIPENTIKDVGELSDKEE